jgi:hypothetical protein
LQAKSSLRFLSSTKGFRKGSANINLYIKVTQDSILLIEVYVDDIIFGSTDDRLSQKFAKDMQNEFYVELDIYHIFQHLIVNLGR